MVKWHMNALLTRDKAMLTAKLNTRDEATYERSATYAAKLRLNDFRCKALGAKLASRKELL